MGGPTKKQFPLPGSKRWLKAIIRAVYPRETREIGDMIASLPQVEKDALITKLLFVEPEDWIQVKMTDREWAAWKNDVLAIFSPLVVEHIIKPRVQ